MRSSVSGTSSTTSRAARTTSTTGTRCGVAPSPVLYWISAPNHDWEPGRNEDLDNFMNGQCPGDTTESAANRLKGWIDNGDPYSFDLDNWHFAMLSSALWRYDPDRAADATRWLDRDLAAAKEKGRHLVVAYHEPYFTSDTDEHSPAEEAQALDRRHRQVRRPADVVGIPAQLRAVLSGSGRRDVHRRHRHRHHRVPGVHRRHRAARVHLIALLHRQAVQRHPRLVELTLEDDGGFTWQFKPVAGPGTDSGRRPPAR